MSSFAVHPDLNTRKIGPALTISLHTEQVQPGCSLRRPAGHFGDVEAICRSYRSKATPEKVPPTSRDRCLKKEELRSRVRQLPVTAGVMSDSPSRSRYAFGSFLFDPLSRELSKFGVKLRFEDKPARVLATLLERPGDVVSRTELQELLWPDGINVDFEHGLNKCVNKLRAVLGDDPTEPIFIETLSGRGYRFVAAVQLLGTPSSSVAPSNGESQREQLAQGTPPVDGTVIPILRSEIPGDQTRKRKLPVTRNVLFGAIAGLLILFLTVFSLNNLNSKAAPSHNRTTRSFVAYPPGWQVKDLGSLTMPPSLSPDGEQMAFVAVDGTGHTSLLVRDLHSLEAEKVENTDGAMLPFWSPDGKEIAFFAEYKLKRANLAKRTVLTICDAEEPRGGTWGPGNKILFVPESNGPIFLVNALEGVPKAVMAPDEVTYTTYRWPEFLPDGEQFLFLAANHNSDNHVHPALFLGKLDGSAPRLIAESDSNATYSAGRLLFTSGGKLIAQQFDISTGTLAPHAEIITTDVDYDPGVWRAAFAATDEILLYRLRSSWQERKLAWFDGTGKLLEQIGPTGPYFDVSLSPDGNSLGTRYGDPDMNVWITHGDKTLTRITDKPINYRPIWSPEGNQVAYAFHRAASRYGFCVKDTQGKNNETELRISNYSLDVRSWSPDGKSLLIIAESSTGGNELSVFDLASRVQRTYLSTGSADSRFMDAQFSPDGRWVAYSALQKGRPEIFVSSFPQASRKFQVTFDGGVFPRWRRDGKELYYMTPNKMLWAVSITDSNALTRTANPRELFRPPAFVLSWSSSPYDVDRTGKRFAVVCDPRPEQSQFVLVTNWQR